MYEITNAHPVTVIVIIGAFLVTPIYAMATYVFSGASKKKGLRVGAGFLVFWHIDVPGLHRRLQLTKTPEKTTDLADEGARHFILSRPQLRKERL
jgi:hypothetical protein